jgi:biopolymer transport protein ExbB
MRLWIGVLALCAIALTAAPVLVVAQDDAATQTDPAAGDEGGAMMEGAEGAATQEGMVEEGMDGEEVVEEDSFTEALPATIDESEVELESLSPLGFVLEKFDQGGAFMWPLLIASIIGLAVIIERLWTLSRARVNTTKLMSQVIGALKQDGIEGGIDVCRRTRGPIAAILHAGLMRAPKGPEAVEKAIESAGTIEMSFLQRGLIILASIANVAPLLGFLGTVSGMIHAFEAIAAAEQVSAKLVATGISEALITTATGLMVAIPVQLMNNFFISRIDRFVLEMEEASIELVDTLVDMESQSGVTAGGGK